MSGMSIDIKVGESRKLLLPNGETIQLTLQKKSGQLARILLEADMSVTIRVPLRTQNAEGTKP